MKVKIELVHSHKKLQVNLENICESEVISQNMEIIPSLVNNLKKSTFSLIEKNKDKQYLIKGHSVSIYEYINSNF